MTVPDFEQLIGEEALDAEGRERLLTAHEALLAAGPPAELPPALAQPPRVEATVTQLPSGRRRAYLVLAAAIPIFAFSLGIAVGQGGDEGGRGGEAFAAAWTKRMQPTAAAPNAWASLSGSKPDGAGNWFMRVRAGGLPKTTGDDYYTLWLTKKGRPVAECGTFRVGDESGVTVVGFTEPYRIKDFDGWVVTLWRGPDKPESAPLLRTSI